MIEQLNVMIGSSMKTVYIQNAFYHSHTTLSPLHNHYYSEIHILLNGSMKFEINNQIYDLESGCLFAIPPFTPHACIDIAENTVHTSFLINASVKDVSIFSCNAGTVKDFLDEIKKSETTKNYSKISAYISLLCNDLFADEKISVKQIEDYGMTINEFFSQLYSKNVKLSDLAKILHLSEKQTSRLVVKHTGNTFKNELTIKRMQVAESLINYGTMSMTEIAHYIGYNSYVGFWKAYTVHKNSRSENSSD